MRLSHAREFSSAADLLARLDAIGASLATDPDALALLGLGSVGTELDRLDEYSDLDFFVVVEPGAGPRFRDHVDWLERVAPLAYTFRNTEHGSKVLFEDGIFCEYAVFEPAELAVAAYTPSRIVWRAERFAPADAEPRVALPRPDAASTEHLLGEALTNLFVGLLRERRGERMAAFRMIQGHALDRIMELAERLEPPANPHRDPFGPERRFEARCPTTAPLLDDLAPGYAHNDDAATAALAFLEANFDPDPNISASIRGLLGAP